MAHTTFEFAPAFRPHWPIRHVLFDFDGTLSFVRAGWAEVMTEMFMGMLAGVERACVVEGIMALNGIANSGDLHDQAHYAFCGTNNAAVLGIGPFGL